MSSINSFGVAVDMGVIPPLTKGFDSKVFSFGVAVDMGIIPPKNFFHSKINSFAVAVEPAEPAVIGYQIH